MARAFVHIILGNHECRNIGVAIEAILKKIKHGVCRANKQVSTVVAALCGNRSCPQPCFWLVGIVYQAKHTPVSPALTVVVS